jgi:hypothetical protein
MARLRGRGQDRAELHLLAGAYALNAVSGPDQDAIPWQEIATRVARKHGVMLAGIGLIIAQLAWKAAVLSHFVFWQDDFVYFDRALDHGLTWPVCGPAGTARRPRPGPGGDGRARAGGRGLPPPGWPRRARGAAVAGVTALRDEHRISLDQASGHELGAVLSAPDVVMLTANVTGGGKATVLMSHHMRALVFAAAGLPPLPAAKGYELWLIGLSGSRPQGMAARPYQARPMMVAGLANGDQVGVTVAAAGRLGAAHHPPGPAAAG